MYILNCDKLKFLRTFKSMGEIFAFLDEKNHEEFDGNTYSIFGRGMHQEYGDDGELVWVNSSYYIDSVVLCKKRSHMDYYTFFIRRIDSKGNLIELD